MDDELKQKRLEMLKIEKTRSYWFVKIIGLPVIMLGRDHFFFHVVPKYRTEKGYRYF